MEVQKLLRNNRLAQALMGISITEFNTILPVFSEALYTEMKLVKATRKRAFGGGKKGTLKTPEEKLAFILIFLKCYPTFDVLGFITNRDRTRACRSVHFLLKVMERALQKQLVLPQRKIHSVEEFFSHFPEAKDVFVDGTERRVEKPKNLRKRKKLYSGKKKATTRKTMVVTDEHKRILIMPPTKSGRRHDKRLLDKQHLVSMIPDDVALWGDTAFRGCERLHRNMCIPKKRTKLHPLTDEDKLHNRLISSIRILVEHALAGLKRFKAASDIYRHKLANADDRFMLISAGLWNFHIQQTI